MFLVFLWSGVVGVWYFFRPVGKREANLLLSFFIGVLSLSLLYNVLVNIGIFINNPRWYFIPIQYTLALGPLLFFYVKSRSYRVFNLQKKDFKHFILPSVQAVSYLMVGFRAAIYKDQVWNSIYLPYGKPLEGFLFVTGFSFYLYFSYRFIQYKLQVLDKRQGYFWEVDKMLRMKRMVKGLIFLFAISAASIIGDFVAYQFLGYNLADIRGYTYIGDLSFTIMVLWVSYYAFRNAFFPSRQRLENTPAIELTLQHLFTQEKIFLDDELDARKLSYYLKINKQELTVFLKEPLTSLLTRLRLEEVEKRSVLPRYRNYSRENIGLDVGFPHKTAFRKAEERMEN